MESRLVKRRGWELQSDESLHLFDFLNEIGDRWFLRSDSLIWTWVFSSGQCKPPPILVFKWSLVYFREADQSSTKSSTRRVYRGYDTLHQRPSGHNHASEPRRLASTAVDTRHCVWNSLAGLNWFDFNLIYKNSPSWSGFNRKCFAYCRLF